MILQFKIKNFRSYKDEVIFSMEPNSSEIKSSNFFEIKNAADQEFKVLKLAMIYGANASGKTAIIRALYEVVNLIINKPKVNQFLRVNDSFKLDEDCVEEPSEFTIIFLGPDMVKYEYCFMVSESIILKEELHYFPKGKITNVFSRNTYSPSNTVQTGTLGSTFGKKKISVFENQLILSKFGDDEPHELLSKVFEYFVGINIINATNERHLDSINRSTSKTLLENENLLRKVKKLIKWADTQIEDIQIIKQIFDSESNSISDDSITSSAGRNSYDIFGELRRYKDQIVTGNYAMSFKNWSHGTQSLYKLGGEIIVKLEEGGVLVVDELDTSLHPFLTKMIVMMFQSSIINPHNTQLIFTTHDVTLLDRDLVRRDQVWLAEKNQLGVSDLYSLQDFDDVREDTPFEKWYLAGKFGGIPKIDSVDSMFEKL